MNAILAILGTSTALSVAILAFLVPQRMRLGTEAASLQRELQTTRTMLSERSRLAEQQGASLSAASERLKGLESRVREFESYGTADGRHVVASLSGVVDREVNLELRVGVDTTWRFPVELKEGYSLPSGRERLETRTERASIPSRKGWLLGTRSHSTFVFVALGGDEREFVVKPPRPPGIKTKSKSDILFESEYQYELARMTAELEMRVGLAGRPKALERGTVIHAWTRDQMLLLVLGFEDADSRDLEMIPIRGNRGWLALAETKGLLFPVGMLNGAIGFVPPRLHRNYDHRGAVVPWQGWMGNIQPVFMPADRSDGPVLHSWILQTGAQTSLWVPAYAEKQFMDAAPGQFDMDDWLKVSANVDKRTLPVSWVDVEGSKTRRLRLLESYRTLMSRCRIEAE